MNKDSLLQAKFLFIEHLDNNSLLCAMLEAEMQSIVAEGSSSTMADVPPQHGYIQELLGDRASIDALIWFDSKLFENISQEALLSLLTIHRQASAQSAQQLASLFGELEL